MLDHVGFPVHDYARSKQFYLAALAPLGYELIMEVEGWGGFGVGGKPDLWFGPGEPGVPKHIAFRASNRAVVDAFYEAAMAAGGQDNGKPGLRLHYHTDYYGAFVLDPDGNNVEAVCHEPETVRTVAASRRETSQPEEPPANEY